MDAKAKSKKWGVWAPTPLSNNATIHLCSLVRNVKAKNREIKKSSAEQFEEAEQRNLPVSAPPPPAIHLSYCPSHQE